jgi:Tfp pilus assembly protein PilE
MKKEDGVTLVSLVATVIVMLILATVTTYSGIESYKEAKKENFIAKMKVIQEKVDLIKSEYKNWS